MPRDVWKKHARVLSDHERNESRRTAGRNPIAPSHNKTRVRAESVVSEDVLPTRTWEHRSKLRYRNGSKQRVETACYPDTDEEPAIWQVLSNRSGSADDAGSNRVADYYGEAETY